MRVDGNGLGKAIPLLRNIPDSAADPKLKKTALLFLAQKEGDKAPSRQCKGLCLPAAPLFVKNPKPLPVRG